jgi:hypothetical protein
MTPNVSGRLGLDMAEECGVGHMGHPHFRGGGKIVTTRGYADDGWAMAVRERLEPMRVPSLVPARVRRIRLR